MYSTFFTCLCCLGLTAAEESLTAAQQSVAAAKQTLQIALLNAEDHFERFIKEHERHYADEKEKQYRLSVFKKNVKMALEQNEKSDNAIHDITQFMDLTQEEFVGHYGCFGSNLGAFRPCKMLTDKDIEETDAPENFDWRQHNVVTRVVQQLCDNCYAISSAGNVEGQFAKKHRQLVQLSQQQIVDCDRMNQGCRGGFMSNAFQYLKQVGGIQTEADYPTNRRKQGRCVFNVRKAAVRVTDCLSFNITSQEKLKHLLYKNGPISVAITIDRLQTYRGGIMSDRACGHGKIAHAVLLVGYGVENGTPYWIVKNSWGTTFGEQGYYRVVRGEGHTSCMMMNMYMASSVVM